MKMQEIKANSSDQNAINLKIEFTVQQKSLMKNFRHLL